MSPVNTICLFALYFKKKLIGKSVLKMADIGKMLNIGADNQSTPNEYSFVLSCRAPTQPVLKG